VSKAQSVQAIRRLGSPTARDVFKPIGDDFRVLDKPVKSSMTPAAIILIVSGRRFLQHAILVLRPGLAKGNMSASGTRGHAAPRNCPSTRGAAPDARHVNNRPVDCRDDALD
jgi:hypothetical protein